MKAPAVVQDLRLPPEKLLILLIVDKVESATRNFRDMTEAADGAGNTILREAFAGVQECLSRIHGSPETVANSDAAAVLVTVNSHLVEFSGFGEDATNKMVRDLQDLVVLLCCRGDEPISKAGMQKRWAAACGRDVKAGHNDELMSRLGNAIHQVLIRQGDYPVRSNWRRRQWRHRAVRLHPELFEVGDYAFITVPLIAAEEVAGPQTISTRYHDGVAYLEILAELGTP